MAQEVQDRGLFNQQVFDERSVMHTQYQQMSEQLLVENAAKGALASKIKRLYGAVREKVDNKEGLDQLFQEILAQEEEPDQQPEPGADNQMS